MRRQPRQLILDRLRHMLSVGDGDDHAALSVVGNQRVRQVAKPVFEDAADDVHVVQVGLIEQVHVELGAWRTVQIWGGHGEPEGKGGGGGLLTRIELGEVAVNLSLTA